MTSEEAAFLLVKRSNNLWKTLDKLESRVCFKEKNFFTVLMAKFNHRRITRIRNYLDNLPDRCLNVDELFEFYSFNGHTRIRLSNDIAIKKKFSPLTIKPKKPPGS